LGRLGWLGLVNTDLRNMGRVYDIHKGAAGSAH